MMGIINQCPLDACQFYQSMMTTYITRAVKPEPKKPGDWSQPGELGDCGQPHCSICLPVKEFMLDPVEKEREFNFANYESLYHVRNLLSSRCDLFLHYSGGSKALSVTKGMSECRVEYNKWEERAKTALRHFTRFVPRADLKRCLGDKYDVIVCLKMLRLPKENENVTAQNTDPSDESSK
jgi:hypothetical protein